MVFTILSLKSVNRATSSFLAEVVHYIYQLARTGLVVLFFGFRLDLGSHYKFHCYHLFLSISIPIIVNNDSAL